MPRLTLHAIRKKTVTGVLAAALTALVGFQATAMAVQAEQLWSIVVHFRYADGLEYDYVLRTGVTAEHVHDMLQDCGRSHRTGSVVRYYCYAVPE